jgi:hypothetical protein
MEWLYTQALQCNPDCRERCNVIFASSPLGRKIDAVPSLLTRSRKIGSFARDILVDQGHTVVRNTGVLPPVDFVAWKPGGDPLLIQVRRTRRPLENAREVAGKFHTDLKQLWNLPKPRHAKVQVWLYSAKEGWKTYDVYPGGLMYAAGGK